MKKTPLCKKHEELGARMVDFGGWFLPVQYEGIVAEHKAVREDCGIFDTCHMGMILVTGSEAADYLSAVLTVDASNMFDGRCRYGFMLNQNGTIIDDLIVYRMSEGRFMVVINSATHEKDLANLTKQLRDGVDLQDLGANTAKIDVQGPLSAAVMNKVLGTDISALRYFRHMQASFAGCATTISHTGYTGETGYEIYLPSEKAADFWQAAINAGAVPCGLGARDTLRLEAGLPLYGHELNEDVTPVEAGFMRYIDLSRDFTGAPALREREKKPPSIKLTPFTIEGRQSARHQNKVVVNGDEAGWVTSGSFAPSLGHCIGFAYIKTELLGNSSSFGIDNGRKILEAQVAESPFYSK